VPRARTKPDDTLSAAWLGSRIGIDTRRVDAMRRGGELIAFRRPGSQEWRYPAWQFTRGFERVPGLEVVIAAGREAGLDGNALVSLLSLKTGMTGSRPLADVLREGRVDHVVEAVRAKAHRP
jgi:hypothetical protein